MRKLTGALVLGVFGSNCWLAWAMLTLMLEVRNAHRALPAFTNLCITFRPLLLVLPVLAAAGFLWLWLRKEERISRWTGLVAATMAALILFVLPVIATSYLLMTDPVRIAVGAVPQYVGHYPAP